VNGEEKREIQLLADELRAIAAFGLNFAGNPHDKERYNAILGISARLSGLLQEVPAAALYERYRENLFSLSAQPSAEAVVIHEGQILLVHRKDDDLWALPGGITDPGETLAQSARRELWEETGIDASPVWLLGIFDSQLWQSAKKIHFYHALFLMDGDDKTPRPSAEVAGAAYFAEDNLPSLSPGHHLRVPFVFKQLRGEVAVPFFDMLEKGRDEG
jgi:8-oxo-dGTP pyrophosphatase MutT (NUDIX family)